jgi:branched-chain amino acid transport system permease protein
VPILTGLVTTLLVGLFSEILTERLRAWFGPGFIVIVFQSGAIRPLVAILVFLAAAGLSAYWRARGESIGAKYRAFPQNRQTRIRRSVLLLGVLSLLILPLALGPYLSEVTDNIGIFILMGLGLNIVVGFAGLLDLGYVAFFAIGAYTMGLLTSTGDLGVAGISFWVAVPIAIAVSVFAGIILGIPVLRMRGDYLAIVTLGFGEIIRILALSDLLKPYIGGAQGVLNIPNPVIGFPRFMVSPQWFFYIILAGCAIAWFVSSRLSEARLGRQWMAMREDEDVAEAMGIRLVSTKLLAFALGAAFSGLSGAIFAPKLTSIFPHSFQLLISINVLAIIIVGGMGSLPGVVVGSIILVGLPELLREFAEYRLLIYGALLVVMMLVRPEGFWPSAVRRRELHAQVELEASTDVSPHPEHIT